MSYKNCKHYDEMSRVVSENKDIEDISFEIDEIKGCENCIESNSTVCSLWVMLAFVVNLGPRLSASENISTIDDLDKEITKSVRGMIASIRANRDSSNESLN